MPTIDEKRVYGDRTGKTELYVAAAVGVVGVDVSGGRIGGFGIDRRCVARDAVAAGGRLAVATDGDVLVRDESGAYESTGFGPAVAVGFEATASTASRTDGGEGRWLAADEGGRIARRDADGDGSAADWEPVGRVGGGEEQSSPDDRTQSGDVHRTSSDEPTGTEGSGDGPVVRAFDGALVAASDGVYRIGERASYTGLDDARDVAADGAPLAATADGLYSLGNGWMDELGGSFRAVVAAADRAHAAADGGAYVRAEGGWEALDLPTDERVIDFAYGGGRTFALTEAGTLLISGGVTDADGDGDGEWRSQTLGLDGATSVAAD